MERRTLALGALSLLAVGTLVTGCSADDDTTASVSTPVTDACSEMYIGDGDPLERAVGTVLIQASQGFDGTVAASMNAVGQRLQEFEKEAPTSFAEPLQKVETPFVQAQEALDQGAADATLDVGTATEGLTEIRELCADAGFAFPSTEATPEATATP